MSLNLTARAVQRNIHGFRTALLSKALHSSVYNYGTHDYDAIDYKVSTSKFQEIVNNPESLATIRKKTGAVVRPKFTNDVEVLEEDSANLLIVGSSFQTRKAIEQLQAVVNGAELSKDDSFISGAKAKKLVWHGYKRNYKGQYPPMKPRKKCIRCGGKMVSGNPCPLCQITLKSKYELHYTDVELLKQFICPFTWNILQPSITGVCTMQQKKVEEAIRMARLYGYLPFQLPCHDAPSVHKPAGVPTDRKIKWKIH